MKITNLPTFTAGFFPLPRGVSLFVIIPLLSFCASANLKAQTSQARDLLNKSAAEMKSLNTENYTIKRIEKKGQLSLTINQTIFVKTNPDGTVWQRTESTANDSRNTENRVAARETIQIQNGDGLWQLYVDRKIAIRLAFFEGKEKVMSEAAGSLIDPSKPTADDSTYNVVEDTQDESPIYVISKTLSDKAYNDYKEKAEKILATAYPSKQIDLGDQVPFLTQTKIRKSDYVVVGEATYSRGGDLITSATFEDVSINLPISDDHFAIPNDYQSSVANSPEDLAKILTTNN